MATTEEWFASIPRLEGWINLTEAAEMLGVSPQHMSRLAHRREFKTVHKIGSKKMLVVSLAEVEEKVTDRREAAARLAEAGN